MRSAAESGRWRQKALTLIGVGVIVVFLAGLGIYTFVMAVSTRLHPAITTDIALSIAQAFAEMR